MPKTKNVEQGSSFYDNVYTTGGWQKTFFEDGDNSCYIKVWNVLINELSEKKNMNIVDLGCGNGQLARLLEKRKLSIDSYLGLDFSTVAINYANEKNTFEHHKFQIEDFNIMQNLNKSNTHFICLEVLEHIEKDLELLKKVNGNNNSFLFSVPNYDSLSHVRTFKDKNEIIQRYSNILNIEKIYPVRFKEDNPKLIIFLFVGKFK